MGEERRGEEGKEEDFLPQRTQRRRDRKREKRTRNFYHRGHRDLEQRGFFVLVFKNGPWSPLLSIRSMLSITVHEA